MNDLSDGTLGINGFGGVFSWPFGYVIISIQVEGIWGYNEDQVALVIPDSTGFGSQVPVTLGTPTINQTINVIKWKWSQWVVGFPEWIKESLIVGLLVSRTFDSEGDSCKSSCGSNQLECGSQNNQEGRSGCFFIQTNTWPNENPAPGGQHAHNDSIPERGWWTPLALWLECGEHIHWGDSGGKGVTVVVKSPMATPITIAKGIKSPKW